MPACCTLCTLNGKDMVSVFFFFLSNSAEEGTFVCMHVGRVSITHVLAFDWEPGRWSWGAVAVAVGRGGLVGRIHVCLLLAGFIDSISRNDSSGGGNLVSLSNCFVMVALGYVTLGCCTVR